MSNVILFKDDCTDQHISHYEMLLSYNLNCVAEDNSSLATNMQVWLIMKLADLKMIFD